MRFLALYLSLLAALQGFAVQPAWGQGKRRNRGSDQAPLSIPVRNMPPMPPGQGKRVIPIRHRRFSSALGQTKAPVGDAAAQTQFGPHAPTIQSTNFEGLGDTFPGFTVNFAPPDTDGAVGRTQYVQLVNTGFVVFDKATQAVVAGPTLTNNLWASLSGSDPCKTTNDGDGIVLYDHLADRWIITQFANAGSTTGPYYECVAISQTADAAGQYFLYFFDFVNTNGTQRLFNDYPKVGVWPDAYYFSYNSFTAAGAPVGAILCALDRTNMLNGAATLRGVAGPAGTPSDNPPNTPAGNKQVCFNIQDFGLLPSDLDGPTLPPTGSPNYFLEWFNQSNLGLWKFHVDFNTLTSSTLNGVNWVSPAGPTASTISPQLISVTAFTATCNWFVTGNSVCVPQCTPANCGVNGTNQQLDSLADRVMHRLAYRNFGNHESLVTNHSVATSGTTGSGIRWYEIQNPNGTPSVVQTGTWTPDTSYRWMGSAAMDKFGNLAIGYSVSSASMNPAIRYAARLSTDSPGTLGNETTLI
ncbi:MAG TPA: hypothetical protein VMS96_06870, partial [Terriglobales bacterium]|nr:hypothetical protein [Terriglobales bacterium]